MSKWTIRNYNTFLREARSKFGISQAQAREVYKTMSGHLGRKLYGTDVGRHPRISKRFSESAKNVGQPKGGKAGKGKGGESGSKGGGSFGSVQGTSKAGSKSGKGTGKKKVSISSLAEFYDYYDADQDYAYDEVESSADYEEATQ